MRTQAVLNPMGFLSCGFEIISDKSILEEEVCKENSAQVDTIP